MRLPIPILLLAATCLSASAQRFVKVFDSIPALLAANPNDVHTNAFVAGLSVANDGGGGIYTWNSASTTATNSNLSVLKANNFATGRWFRDNGFLLTALTTDRVAVIGTDSVLTNGSITITELNTLGGVSANIQNQIDDIVLGNSNWQSEGTTNSTLPGIAKPWAVEATNHISVGTGSTSPGVIDIASTNGTHTIRITVDENGTLVISHGSTNMLTLQLGSLAGHAGTGTNFLADDGVFKGVSGGGGGDSIWTRTNGMITAESTVADGDTAFSLTSSNNIGNSYILTATNNGALVFAAAAWGGLELFGDNSYISMDDSLGNLLTFLSPTRSSSQTPYFMDTIQAHDPGTMMLEINNFGTNVFTVAAVSGHTGTGTKAFYDDGVFKYRTKTLPLFRFPDSLDGTGCTYVNTNDVTVPTFMRPRFSATAATNANFATFSCLVPSDLNTAVDLTATIKVALAAGDTDASTYTLGMASVANNNSSAATAANYIVLTIPPDIGGFSGWVEGVSNVTLTGWRSAMTPGQWLFIRLQRDGSDASSAAQDLLALEITYTSTQ